MASFLKNLVLHFMSDKCYNELFVKFNFLEVECLKQAISKALGTGIILGSLLVKVPQILKLFNAKSGKGISLLGVLLELTAITSSASYSFAKGYPFSSWGDSLCMMVQTSIVAFLVLFYDNQRRNANTFAVLYGLTVYMLFSGLVPVSAIWSIQLANVPIVIAGKLIQALQNYKSGHTGQLSAITMYMLFLGSSARIFTSIQETGDTLIITNFALATLCNGLICAQILYYRSETQRFLQEKEKKSE